MGEDWKITLEGKKYLQNNMTGGNGEDRYKSHSKDEIFEYEIHGILITVHICMESNHAVMLIEGNLWDSSAFFEDEGKSAKEIHEKGKNLFINYGLNNLFLFYPKLKEYIDKPENFNLGNKLSGISIF